MKHLNPRQGITTCRRFVNDDRRRFADRRVKHLNPRQGITTLFDSQRQRVDHQRFSVKHLNPRQGITTPCVSICVLLLVLGV